MFFNNAVIKPHQAYEYDALYRLVYASGREHVSLEQPANTEHPVGPLPNPNDPQALRSYVERYDYDNVGNILQMRHEAVGGSWTRRYDYAADGNRLLATSVPGDGPGVHGAVYAYNSHGSMSAMPHLAAVDWDLGEQMRHADLGGGGDVWFVYYSAGQRVRKVQVNAAGSTRTERIYLGGYEVYREHVGGALRNERQTLHVADGSGRVCMLETQTVDDGVEVVGAANTSRYQYGNHLGSVGLELDGSALLISYEEFHPYGSTAYRAANSAIEVSASRYRYTGQERDEETGLGHHGARYYAGWLGRWTSADPIGLGDGVNRFAYVGGNPIGARDSSGTAAEDEVTQGRPDPSKPVAKAHVDRGERGQVRLRGLDSAPGVGVEFRFGRGSRPTNESTPPAADNERTIPLTAAGYPAAVRKPGVFRALDVQREANALREGLHPRPADKAFVPTETQADMTFRQTRPGGDKLAKGTNRISFGAIEPILENVAGAGAERPIVRLDPALLQRSGGKYLPQAVLLQDIEQVRAREAAALEGLESQGGSKRMIKRTSSRVRGTEVAQQKIVEFRESHTVGPVPPEAISPVADAAATARAERLGSGLSRVGRGIAAVGIGMAIARIGSADREDLPRVIAEEIGALGLGVAGAAAGAKLGVAIGAFLGPVGAVVGGFVGGLLGGVGFGILGADLGRTFHRDYLVE